MHTALIGLLVITAQPTAGVQAPRRISPQAAAEGVSRCGLGPVAVRYDDLLQSEVLTAGQAIAATDEQLRCADRAAGYYDLELPSSVQARYEAMRAERAALLSRLEAKQWLTEQGLLKRLPTYERGVTDESAFTRSAEKLCGPRASGALSSPYGHHVVSPDWIGRELGSGNFDSRALRCLMSVAWAAGYDIGLIGNEAGAVEPTGNDR